MTLSYLKEQDKSMDQSLTTRRTNNSIINSLHGVSMVSKSSVFRDVLRSEIYVKGNNSIIQLFPIIFLFY